MAIFLTICLPGPFSSVAVVVFPMSALDAALGVLAAFVAAFVEEIICRGYLMKQFEIWIGSPWIAAITQACLFAAAHGYDQTFAGYLHKFLMGLLFAWAAIRYRSIMPGIFAHAIFNASLVCTAWLVFRSL